jgi:hypothetical protein
MFLTQARTPRDTTKFPTAQLFVLGMFLIGSNPLSPFCCRAQVIAGLDLKNTLHLPVGLDSCALARNSLALEQQYLNTC